MRSTLALVAGVLLAAAPLSAQAPAGPGGPGGPAGRGGPPPSGPGEVKGIVAEATSGAPVPRASVAIRAKANGMLAAGAIAGPDGAFRVQGLRPGAYSLRITYLGFGLKIQDIAITPAAPLVDVGTIKLARVATQLEGVAVVDKQDAVSIEPDRNTYRAKQIAPTATNASEVLEATPSVTVDGDGKVSLRGNESVAIQINGRPAPISGAQLGAYLKSLPANLLERIEVVPNPSAKYDPEGMAGIINIVLKQNVDLGISAGLTVGAANADRYNTSGNLGYQVGKITSFSSLGIFKEGRDVVGINNRLRFDAVKSLIGVTEQDIAANNGFQGQNFNTNVDYKLTARDLFSNSISINHRESANNSVNTYSELNGSRTVVDHFNRPQDVDSKGLSIDYTSALKRTFEPRKHELSGEVRFNYSHDQDVTALWRQTIGASGIPDAARTQAQHDDVDAVTKNVTAQLDYVRPVGKAKLETGFKGYARFLDRDYQVVKDSLGTGQWLPSSLSNAFAFDEQVQALYGVLSRPVGKVELQGGLRAEYASRDFSLATPAKSYPHHYTSLFPSGILNYNLNASTQAKASYSRRIRRPGTQELNPFPTFFDVQNVFLGNPALNPEYTDAYELGLTRSGKFGSLQISPFYRHTTNVIRFILNTSDVVDGRDVTTISFKNLAVSNSWGSDVNGSFRLGKRVSGFVGGNVFKQVTEAGSVSSVAGTDAVTWSSRVNVTTDVTPTLSLQGFYFYRAGMKIEGGRMGAFQITNFSVKKKLDGDKASLSVRFSDPFNTGKFRVQAGDAKLTQITERNMGNRAAYLTFQYNYGQTPRVRQPKPDENQASQSAFQ
ncbi:MAG TPA: TonB-dependent receptor [Gemmatimonadaceae bacterium]|nr:TonB-dependent receptor [Gemmatimonadaceae bacterium]